MSEAAIVSAVRAAFSNGDARLWRNNVGVLQDRTGAFVTYGLCPGSSDLIGYRSVVITPSQVGQRVAIFCALEGKRDASAKPTKLQQQFLSVVRDAGGIAGVFSSVAEARSLLTGESK